MSRITAEGISSIDTTIEIEVRPDHVHIRADDMMCGDSETGVGAYVEIDLSHDDARRVAVELLKALPGGER